jgi:DNA invertase Pin-like site-specific DNA recombinase
MKAHIYCRVSTTKGQSDGYQLEECVQYCQEHGIEIAGTYKHVQSSRFMKNKDYLENIINKMEKGDILIIHSICRFSRNLLGGLQVLDMMDKKKLKIYSVDEHVGYDDMYDRRKFRDIMNEAELETDKISRRVTQGKQAAKKRRLSIDNKKNMFIDPVITRYNKKRELNN